MFGPIRRIGSDYIYRERVVVERIVATLVGASCMGCAGSKPTSATSALKLEDPDQLGTASHIAPLPQESPPVAAEHVTVEQTPVVILEDHEDNENEALNPLDEALGRQSIRAFLPVQHHGRVARASGAMGAGASTGAPSATVNITMSELTDLLKQKGLDWEDRTR